MRDAGCYIAVDDQDMLDEILVEEQLIQLLVDTATLLTILVRRQRDAVGHDWDEHNTLQ